MRKKPKGGKYRHLTVVKSRKGTPVIYYFKTENGKRIRISTEKDNWDEAAAWKRRYEDGQLNGRSSDLSTFREARASAGS